jgi:hypothetical protein
MPEFKQPIRAARAGIMRVGDPIYGPEWEEWDRKQREQATAEGMPEQCDGTTTEQVKEDGNAQD